MTDKAKRIERTRTGEVITCTTYDGWGRVMATWTEKLVPGMPVPRTVRSRVTVPSHFGRYIRWDQR